MKNNKGSMITIIVLSIFLLCSVCYIIFGQKIINKFTSKEIKSSESNEEKVENTESSSAENNQNDNKKVICKSSFKYDDKTFDYQFVQDSVESDKFNLEVYLNNYKLDISSAVYNNISEDISENELCKENVLSMELLSKKNDFEYVIFRFYEKYIVLYHDLGAPYSGYYKAVDLTDYSRTIFINSITNEEVEQYRISDNSIYVIEKSCYNDKDGKEVEFNFDGGHYTKKYTGNDNFTGYAGALNCNYSY